MNMLPHRPSLLSRFACLILVGVLSLSGSSLNAATGNELPDLSGYEIYTMGKADRPPKGSFLLPETPRHGLNDDGLIGFFVAETADKLQSKRMFSSLRFHFNELTSHRGKAFHPGEQGSINTFNLSLAYVGDWAEWAVTVPIQKFSVSAPKSFSKTADENTGLGNLRFAWKATYLPDKSYYRFAYGAVAYVSTGNPTSMWVTNKKDDELKVFGCVTTKESDSATANLELGTILDSGGTDNRFIYRLGLTYAATQHATLIGELAGDVWGGDDKDLLDLIAGIRLAPSPTAVFELAYTKNLRTYREFGWDERFSTGLTIRW